MRATRAIIHLENFLRNLETVREKTGGKSRICVPVKANAYGHGAVEVSRCAVKAGAEYLAVATVPEGAELRAAGISAPILLFSQALPEELPDIISNELTPFVSDSDFIDVIALAAGQVKRKVTVHLKVDTGMGRLGCSPKEASALAVKIASQKSLALGGVSTHLAVSDSLEKDNVAYTKEQLCKFREAVDSIKNAGIEPGIVHAANSGIFY